MPDFKIRLSTEEIITWSQSKVHTFHEPAIPVTDTAAVIIVSENFLQIACVFFSIISLMLMLLSLQFNWRVYCRCLLLLLNMLISVLIISWSWWPNLVRSTTQSWDFVPKIWKTFPLWTHHNPSSQLCFPAVAKSSPVKNTCMYDVIFLL